MSEFEEEEVSVRRVMANAAALVNSELNSLHTGIRNRDQKIDCLEKEKKFAADQVNYWQGVADFEKSLKLRESEKFGESIVMLYLACATALIAIGYGVWVG